MQSENLKVAIVGGGLAGFTAACRILQAKPQTEITIFEKSAQAGGRASTKVKEGFHLNQGAHALYRAGSAMAFLKEIGLTPAGAAPNTFDGTAIYGDEFFTLPLSPGDMIKTKLFSTVEKVELSGFLLGLNKFDQAALASTNVSDWLDKVSKNAKVKELLQAILRLCTYSNNPEKLSAGAAVGQLIMSQGGVLYLDGGWQSIVDGLWGKVQDLAAQPPTLRPNTAVTGLQSNESSDNGRSNVTVITGGAQVAEETFDAVILAVPPAQVAQLLPEAIAADVRQALDKCVPGRVAGLDICLKKAPAPKTVYGLGVDEPLYYSMHSSAAKLTAEAEQALIHMAYYLPHGEVGNERHEARMLSVLDRLQPGWQDELVYKRYLPEMTADYGQPLASQSGVQGLASPILPLANVFAAGDFVGSNKFLADGAVTSALRAADLLLEQTKNLEKIVLQTV
ncbi:MAG: FAD-dependent oxidoreductase [Cyanobacteria bacterium REEB67]|nr:FAD-dependent oxidoreductase [Cyanobacteria bacterium REEB67]